MIIDFHKMQALGNDFVIIEYRYSEKRLFNKESLINISHRLYGVGCDQVVIFYRENCFVHASFFNNDGSEAEICGNASRCLGKLMKRLYGILRFPMVAAGRDYDVQVNNDDMVSVNIERPSLKKSIVGLSRKVESLLNLSLKNDLKIKEDIFSGFKVLKMVCVSVGNPHLVVFLDKIPPIEKVSEIGRILSVNELFANGINVSFANVISDDLIEQSSFERGTGLTLACGSGACATAFLARECDLTRSRKIVVQQRGGSLSIVFNEDETITQTGTASYVFFGKIEV